MDFYRFLGIFFVSFGFFMIFPYPSEYSRILSYPLALFRILPDSFQSSWNFVGFSHILTYCLDSIGFLRILLDSLRLFRRILSHSFELFLHSSGFSRVLSAPSYSLGFLDLFRTLSVSFEFFRIFFCFIGIFLDSLVFSRTLLDFFGFSKIIPVSLKFCWILMDFSGFFQFLSDFSGFSAYFLGILLDSFVSSRILSLFSNIFLDSYGIP